MVGHKAGRDETIKRHCDQEWCRKQSATESSPLKGREICHDDVAQKVKPLRPLASCLTISQHVLWSLPRLSERCESDTDDVCTESLAASSYCETDSVEDEYHTIRDGTRGDIAQLSDERLRDRSDDSAGSRNGSASSS